MIEMHVGPHLDAFGRTENCPMAFPTFFDVTDVHFIGQHAAHREWPPFATIRCSRSLGPGLFVAPTLFVEAITSITFH
jgi:hypothetical protein